MIVRQIDFTNVNYVEIRNSSECHVVLGWLIQNLFLPPHPTAFAATFSPKEKAFLAENSLSRHRTTPTLLRPRQVVSRGSLYVARDDKKKIGRYKVYCYFPSACTSGAVHVWWFPGDVSTAPYGFAQHDATHSDHKR